MSLKSAFGPSMERARNYAEDHTGKRINHDAEYEGIRCKSGHAYAPAPASDSHESLEELMVREGRLQRLRAGLDDRERRFLQATRKIVESLVERKLVAKGDRQEHFNQGWGLVPLTTVLVERSGMLPLECDEMARELEPVEVDKVSYAALAAEWGVNLNKAREIGRSALKAYRAATRR